MEQRRATSAAGLTRQHIHRLCAMNMTSKETRPKARQMSPVSVFIYRTRLLPAILLGPCLLWIAFFFLIPLITMTWRSLSEGGFSVAAYHEVLTSPQYLKVALNTAQVLTLVTIATLILGYPIAYILTMTSGWIRALILILVSIPYWVDVIVRSFSWLILLGDNGIINKTMLTLGIIDHPSSLLYNRTSVLLGITQILLPMMIITLYGAMIRIDRSLLRAATIHGASDLRAFWHVFFPLSLPGVYGACLLTFVLGLGFYVTPALLGSPRETMITQTIMIEATENLNYEHTSAASIMLLIVTMAIVMVYNRYFGLDRLWGGGKT